MATKLITTYEITTYPKGNPRHRVMVSVAFDTQTIGNFETQNIVIYSGDDEDLAKKLAEESAADVQSGGVRRMKNGVEEK